LKLARNLIFPPSANILFIFDEPTIGLHYYDLAKLITIFQSLVEKGHSLIIVEHNLEIIKCADYLIDLGPEGGDAGGYIVATGTPEEIATCLHSWTGKFLLPLLKKNLLPKQKAKPIYVSQPKGLSEKIEIIGAKEHNLKNINLAIPHQQLVIITGISGSGKSTLAFDILFAEGQRRYLESLTPYIRQYLKIRDKPNVDLITGIPPTVAIEQRMYQEGKRSIVATLTEIYHFLRLLYSKLGTQYCPSCNQPITSQRIEEIIQDIQNIFYGERVVFFAPKVSGKKGLHKDILLAALKKGYNYARIDKRIICLDSLPILSRYQAHDIDILIGQTDISLKNQSALKEFVQESIYQGNGSFLVVTNNGKEKRYSTVQSCPRCQKSFEPLDPRLFSFNTKQGACPRCAGMGFITNNHPSYYQESILGNYFEKMDISSDVEEIECLSL
ncbi:MAG: excinuclease ABC subunit A, partial [Desulfobacterota bacterium]|nr:excinuclease ABC subunit A [Thermodesulfobacteriota bacterium]